MDKINNLNGEMLARACAFAAKPKDPRFYLRSVYVENREEGGVYIVATNGHVLCCYTDEEAIPDEDFESVMIDIYQENSSRLRPIFTQLKKTSEARIDVENQDGQGGVSIRHNDDTTFVRTIEGTFPDWQKIFKYWALEGADDQLNLQNESVAFDPKYLAMLKDLVLKGSNDLVSFVAGSDAKVNVFQTSNAIVGIMPCRAMHPDTHEFLEVSNG
jgi:hypothetical protein